MTANIIKKILFALTLLILSIFSNGQYAVFFAIWVFTAMLLYAVRKLPRWKGFLMAFLVIGIGYYIGFDVVPFIPISISLLIAAIFSLFASLPYLIDSFFSKKNNSFLTTLIFPTAAVLMEYAYHQLNQYGTWGHFAYTQQSQHILLQSISVFGMGYITFLITWFASVSNWIYEQRNEWRTVKKGVLIYSLVLVFTLCYGGYRVQFQKPNSETIRIASISALDSLNAGIDIQGINDKETANDAKIKARRNTSKLNDYLFERSIAEAKAGAKIVFWAEGNAVILKEDENKLYKQASQIASEQNIYLGLGIAVVDPSNSKYLENKFVLFDKNGSKVMDYWKGISVPGVEAPISNNKATGIQKIETEYGTIAGVICFDLDFPNYLKEAKGSDILLAPSNDYKEIDQLHTNMAKFRALEQGFNLVRQASLGHSIGADYTGKMMSEMNHFTDNSKVMITQLPTKGTKTIYSIIGDSFIVFCLLSLILVITVIRKKKAEKINA
ncbi:nitrilase-related carbon-nitrogen hydrolase [Marivirga salinae]|uniref:Nitrilase-related carbon-nitrogen hydrolase n=1 Tax=Marivirga salinarum TaxID=3059078 RepID=A0AA49GBG0_9BACT|nr:nitrilase-related carbon-nitrogen hydrolase [Marivirga sp. BDSF4-3]WKK73605.2 nitrilase-related carbon-nitrogen hydrolase [Marivirga sp. BDSF4-3]